MKDLFAKRALAMLLALCMVLSMLPGFEIQAAAAEDTENIVSDADTEETENADDGNEAATLSAGPVAVDSSAANAYFQVGSSYYSSLDDALLAAGESGTIVLVKDVTVSGGNYDIPAGVTLLLPYAAGATGVTGTEDKYPHANYTFYVCNSSNCICHNVSVPGDEFTYLKMTLENCVLNVYGEIIIGGTVASSSFGNSGHIYGAHSDIFLSNSSINVCEGGILSSVGFIYGDGDIKAMAGFVYEPFIVTDYHGGTFSAVIFLHSNASPFNSYTMNNIQCDMMLTSDATLYGYANLLANNLHNQTTSAIMGGDIALITLDAGSVATISYDPDKYEAARPQFGLTTVTIDGGGQMGVLELKVEAVVESIVVDQTIKTTDIYFPLPYNYHIVLENGEYDIPNLLKIMPGAELTVAENAELTISNAVAIYDGYEAISYENLHIMYPTGARLDDAGFSERGHLYIEGKLNVNGTLGGLVESRNGTGIIVMDSDATTSVTLHEGALKGEKPAPALPNQFNSTTKLSTILSAQVYSYGDSSARIPLVKGYTYYAAEKSVTMTESGFSYSTYGDEDNSDDVSVATAATTAYQSIETVSGTWARNFAVRYFNNGEMHSSVAYVPGASVNTIGPLTSNEAGVTFLGWAYSDDTLAGFPFTMPRGDVILNAVWQASNYTIKYDGNGADSSSYMAADNTPKPGVEHILAKNRFIRTGYVFAGWNTMADGSGTAYADQATIIRSYGGTLVLYAQWAPVIYMVEFFDVSYDADGIPDVLDFKTQELSYGELANLRKNTFSREGYIFTHWIDDNGNAFNDGQAVINLCSGEGEAFTLYAVWEKARYTVSFNTNEGSVVAAQTVAHGETAVKPVDPVKAGYVFAGWYTDAASTNAWDFGQAISGNIVLYASWTPASYTVSFDANGGECGTASKTVTYNSVYGELPYASRVGYQFAGWYTASEGGEAVNSDAIYMMADNITLYAHWTANTYTVKFDANGGSGSMSDQSFSYGSPQNLYANSFTRAGYSFAGWKDAQGNSYVDRASVSNLVNENGGSITLYAQWTADSCSISFNSNGGSSVASISVNYGDIVEITAEPTRTGYSFAGWYDNEACSGEKLSKITVNGDVTLYAKWTANKYTVTWMTDGVVFATTQVEYGGKITVPANTPAKTGYTFVCWEGYSAEDTVDENGRTYTAKWAANSYTVRFDANGGSGTMAQQSFTYGVSQSLAANGFSREGYSFVGWKDGNGVSYTDGQSVKNLVAEDGGSITLYAQWATGTAIYRVKHYLESLGGEYELKTTQEISGTTEAQTAAAANQYEGFTAKDFEQQTIKGDGSTLVEIYYTRNSYTVNWVADGVSFAADDVKYEEEIKAPEGTPTKTGYTFDGWKDYTEGATMGAGNVVYTALWTANSYTVSLVYGNGQADSSISVRYDGKYDGLPSPTREGYSFDGWYTEAEGGNKVETTTVYTIAGDSTLYAHWTINKYTIKFVTNGGSAVSDVKAEYGETVSITATSEKTGHTFAGWYASSDLSGEKLSEITVSGNITLYAKWTVNTYKVNWLVDGKVFTTTEVKYGETISAPQTVPEKTGHSFKAWKNFAAGSTVMGAADRSFEAEWTVNSYTVTWNVDGVTSSVTYEYGAKISAPTTPEKTGHTFAGWEGFTEGDTMGAADVTYTAKWTVNSYNVVWNTDGVTETVSYKFGETIKAPAEPTKVGYTFTGWEGFTEGDTMGAADVTYTAKWTVNSYTVKYYANDGSGSSFEQQFSYIDPANSQEKNVLASGDTFRCEGHSFDGWNTMADGSGTDYSGGEQVGNLSTEANAVIELYAQWNVNSYTITFMDGEAVYAQRKQAYGTAVSAPDAPRKDGYIFDGWDKAVPETMPAENMTINATWSSYLELLNAVVIGDDTLEQARGYYAKLNSEQLSAYTGTEHQIALFAAIKAFSISALESSVVEKAPEANQLLDGIAQINVSEDHYAEIYVLKRDERATALLNIDFITTLFSNADIKEIAFPAITDTALSPYPLSRTIEDQMNLMLLVAYATLGDGRTYDDFVSWLMEENTEENPVTVGVMDGKSVDVVLMAETSEGIEYEVSYTLSFVNKVHDVYWYTGETDSEGVKVTHDVVPYEEGQIVSVPETEPEKTGHSFAGWMNFVEGTKMGRENLSYTAQWTANRYTITFDTDGGSAIEPITADYGSAIGKPADPKKEGYTFAGWDKEIPATMPAENITIKALWSVNSYTITWNIDGIETVQSYKYGETISAPKPGTKTGYTFAGWGREVPETMPAESLEFTAQWTANSYTVTLVYGDGRENGSVTVYYDGDYSVLGTPERVGYGFNGWFTAAEGGEQVLLTDKVKLSENITLYAQWTAGAYSIKYLDSDGSELSTSNPSSYTTESENIVLVSPEKIGHSFLGWTWEGQTEPVLQVTIPTGSTGNRVYTANWSVNRYTISFNTDGGTEIASITADYGAAVNAPADPVREGYSFVGWDKTIPATMPAENMTITALWRVNEYTVTWIIDGVPSYKTYKYGDTIELPAEPVKEGYSFSGWGAEVPETMAAKNLVFTAQWTVNQYTITWIVDGVETVESYDYGETIAVPATPSKTGHSFSGWGAEVPETMPAKNLVFTAQWKVNTYTLSYFVDGVLYQSSLVEYGTALAPIPAPTKLGHSFSGWQGLPETMPDRNVEVRGSFTANVYTVTLNANGGSVEPGSIEVTYGKTYGSLPTPERIGYNFDGWYTAAEGGNKVNADTLMENAGASTLYAHWDAKTFTVSFDAAGGIVSTGSITVKYGQNYGKLPVPERAGYSFVGWFDGSVQVTENDIVKLSADQTLTAKWNAEGDTPYTVYHYVQELEGDGYTLELTEKKFGATESNVQASLQSYTGFHVNTARSTLEGSIAGNGSLELYVYYDRDVHTITWNVAGKVTQEKYRYGATPVFSGSTDKASDTSASYVFTGWDKELVTVTADAEYTALYKSVYEAAVISVYTNADKVTVGEIARTYSTLALALANAKNGEIVRIESDVSITEDLTIPTGVTLVIPCVDNDPGYVPYKNGTVQFNHNGTNTAGKVGVGPDAKLYRTLTIEEGAKLTVNGTMMVNAVTGRPIGGSNEMDVTGGYGVVQLEGDIVVNSKGKLECFGYIKGEGLLTAKKDGTVGDLFIVRSWRGGNQGLEMAQSYVYPMNESDCCNIEADMRIEYGASLTGLVKMYANTSYYYTRFPQIDNSNGLLRIADENGYVLRSIVDGREVYEMHGGGSFASTRLFIVSQSLSTSMFLYPIDGDMDISLHGGEYSFVNDYKFMTGATLTVGGDASLTVNEGVRVVLYDEFHDVDNSDNTEYPEREAAYMRLEYGAKFINAGSFAGTIYTRESNIEIGAAPVWGVTTKEANGYYSDCDGETTRELSFELIIDRPGYSWRFGEAARGEVENSIVWTKENGLSTYAVAEGTSYGVKGTVTVNNTLSESKTCTAVIAAYDENGRLLKISYIADWTVAVGDGNSKSFTIITKDTVDSIKVILLDENNHPAADVCTVSVN